MQLVAGINEVARNRIRERRQSGTQSQFCNINPGVPAPTAAMKILTRGKFLTQTKFLSVFKQYDILLTKNLFQL